MTPASSTPVVGYCRVSTEEQGDSGNGLDAQEEAIRRACDARGWLLSDVVREVGSGATTARRPELARIIGEMEGKGGEAPRAVVVAKLDRLTRSVADGARLFERAARNDWGIVALDLGVDTTTAAGELVANVMIAVGQWERKVIGERTKAALKAKMARGERVGRPRATDQTKRPEEAERMAYALERIRAFRAGGKSYRWIAEALNAEEVCGPQGGQWFQQSVRMACIRYGIQEGKR